jgi:uncharacterized membrane protein YqaE (UPF0057 family)
MKTKNLLWAALLGLAVSCTVSKRIDKWGYKVSFNKNKQVELSSDELAGVPATEKSNAPINSVEPMPSSQGIETASVNIVEANSPQVVVKKANGINAKTANGIASVKLNKKAERIMAKLNSNEAKTSNSNRTENWVYILLILLVPFGCTISMYLYEGSWTKRVTTNLLLTLLCGLPGLIHALVVIFGNK